MKIAFILNVQVDQLLPKSIDRKKLVEACEAYRNKMVTLKEEGKRNLRITGGKSSPAAQERQNITVVTSGESNVVARFIAYNDEIRVLSERAAKSEATVSLVQIPSEFAKWIASTFDKARSPKPEAKAGNGEHKPAETNRLAPVAA